MNILGHNPFFDGCYSDLIYTDQFDTSKNIRYCIHSNLNLAYFQPSGSHAPNIFFT